MTTAINGTDAPWTTEIWQLWYTHVEIADPKLYDTHGLPSYANYFTARPFRDQYATGDTKEGFTFTVGRKVYQQVIAGGVPWLVSEPRR